MANYNIVVDSKFTPFSYLEMLAPVLMATLLHLALEEQYADLSAKASAWAAKANKESDPYAYNMYKTYANDLEKKAGNLARQGLQLGGTSVRDMLGMKSRYNEEILPIEQAYLTRLKLMGDQLKATFTDPSLMYSRDASTTSLDDYIKNPQISYEVRSGKMLAAQVSTAAAALAKEARENPEEWKSILGGLYYEKLKAKGFSSDAVLEAIKNSPNASPKLTKIVDDVIASSGIEGWNNADILERAKAYAREGLWSAVGESTNLTLKNENYLNPMLRYQLKRMKEEDDAKKNLPSGGIAPNPLNLYSKKESTMADDLYNIAKRDYSKYFYKKNGKWYISSEGIKEFNTTKPTTGLYSFTKEAKTPKFEESSFKTFMKELGVSYIGNQISFRDANRVGTIWGNYIENSPESKRSKYDATKSTEYDYTYSSVDAKDVKKSIAEALAGNEDPKLLEVLWNGKNFVATGNTLALSDLNKDEYSITSSRMKGRDNNTVMIKDDDGNVKRYRMPVGINTTNENNRDVELEWAEILRNHPNGGEIRIPDSYARANGLKIGTTINASAELVLTEYTRAISSAYKYHSLLGVLNTTSSLTFKPFAY